MTKTTTPEEIYGPVDLDEYMNKKNFKRNTAGKLPEATFAFLDEPGKASSSILNTLLTIMNEKLYHNGNEVKKVPLRSLVSASNEFFEGEELDALFDRFVIKLEVVGITETANRMELLVGTNSPRKLTTIKLKELDSLVSKCSDVTIPKNVLKRVLKIQEKLKDAGIRVSDRVLHRTCADKDRHGTPRANILKAQALLAGREEVNEDDLTILEHAFWTTLDERDKARIIIRKEANPYAQRVAEILAKAKEYYETGTHADSKMDTVGAAQAELKALVDEIDTILNDRSKKRIWSRARTARKQMEVWNKEMVEGFITL
jgi:MoxR-like ATPase